MNNGKDFQHGDELPVMGGGGQVKAILEWNPALRENLVR